MFPVFRTTTVTAEEFTQFWDRCYSGYDEEFYQNNVGQPLTPERITQWFVWKNGTPLSPGKAKSILRYSSPEERLDADADFATVRQFLNRPGGTIWRIFWLHVQHPTRFPIYDQHVHRAMANLLGWADTEIPVSGKAKTDCYVDRYIPFFQSLGSAGDRRVDRALWAYGRFLSVNPNFAAC